MGFGHLLTGQLNQVGSEGVLVVINLILELFDLFKGFFVVVPDKRNRLFHSFLRGHSHIVNRHTALLNCKRRVSDKAVFKACCRAAVVLFLAVLENSRNKLFYQICKRQHQNYEHKTHNCVCGRQRKRIHYH